MKNFILFLLPLLIVSCSANRTIVQIPPGQSIEIDYPNYDSYQVKVKNKTGKSMEVAVLNKETNDQLSGFGIGLRSEQTIMVSKDSKLVLKNNGSIPASLRLFIEEKAMPAKQESIGYKSLTLRNNSAESIPLIIPTVMNPNLSPFSNSGVDLKVGQEIYFKSGGKKYVLLEVDDSIENGSKIDVSRLIRERKQELGID